MSSLNPNIRWDFLLNKFVNFTFNYMGSTRFPFYLYGWRYEIDSELEKGSGSKKFENYCDRCHYLMQIFDGIFIK